MKKPLKMKGANSVHIMLMQFSGVSSKASGTCTKTSPSQYLNILYKYSKINELKLADEVISQIKIQDSCSHEINTCKFNSKVTLKLLYIFDTKCKLLHCIYKQFAQP